MPVPWFIGSNGALHRPEVVRTVSFMATNGGEGVGGPTHLKVQALATPAGQIRVNPGAVAILNRYPGATDFQTYIDRYNTQVTTPVTQTTSSGARSDLVVARIMDPDFAGEIPADPVNGPYSGIEIITGVPSGTTRAADLNLNYPATELARIDIPATTATITNSMITDLRKLMNPRRDRQIFASQVTSQQDLVSPSFVIWPSAFQPTVRVPSWATHANLVAQLAGVYNITSPVAGLTRAGIGSLWTSDVQYDTPATSASDPNALTLLMAKSGIVLTPEMRNTTQTLTVRGMRSSGSGALRVMQGRSTIMFDIEFVEAPL